MTGFGAWVTLVLIGVVWLVLSIVFGLDPATIVFGCLGLGVIGWSLRIARRTRS